LQTELDGVRKEHAPCADLIASLRKQIASLEAIMDALKKKITDLEEENQKLQTQEKMEKVEKRVRLGAAAPAPVPPPQAPRICGVGMLLQAHEGYDELWVTKLVPGHPAALCGQIMVQDVLCAVDGTPVLGWDLDAVCDIIKGEEGTPVVLEFLRGGHSVPYKITLQRGGDQLWKLPKTNTPRGDQRGGSMPPPVVRGGAPDYGFSVMRH